uniref:C-C motif chemokine 20-like n=1 Tax=Pristiophorus japonicus TaxID=55135 RepID=UPI00398E62E9
MRFQLIALVLMAACFYLSTSQASSFEDCCLSYVQVKRPKRLPKHIISYRVQTTGGGCNLDAIVLELRCVSICVDPNEKWVINYMKSFKMKNIKRRQGRPEFCRNRKKVGDSYSCVTFHIFLAIVCNSCIGV